MATFSNQDNDTFQQIQSQVLYEDNHIIVINKQPSQIVHSDKTQDESLEEQLKTYLKIKYNKPGDAFIGVCHRLDRPVSGAVIFAKTSKALTRLNEMIKERKVQKTYWAITRNRPTKDKDTLKDYILRNEKNNKSYITKDVNNGLYAELTYTLIAQSDYYNLLEVNLKTGRHHQIRVQLAHIGCPIKGDLKYGYGRSNKVSSISLHARKIEFVHPVSKLPLCIIAPCPKDPLWQYFEQTINDQNQQ